jgi:hypothetical protein
MLKESCRPHDGPQLCSGRKEKQVSTSENADYAPAMEDKLNAAVFCAV